MSTKTTPPIEGTVRFFRTQTESGRGPGNTFQVWTFQVERFNQSLERIHPISVQMRGRRFLGSINDGDQVKIYQKWKEGRTLDVNKLYNETTHSWVRIKKNRGLLLFLLFVILIIIISYVLGQK